MESLSLSIEEFAAKRRKEQDDFTSILLPLVRDAIEDRRFKPVLDRAIELYREVHKSETTAPIDKRDEIALRLHLRKALQKTKKTSDPEPTALAVSLAVMNAATMSATKSDEQEIILEWVTMGDRKVRETHEVANGQQRPTGETFTVGGFQMPYPGFPGAPVELWINCRCVLKPVLPNSELGSEAGNLWHSDVHTLEGEVMADEVTEEETPTEEPSGARTWYGVLAPEGIRSGDGRMFKESSLRARELPLPLTWQKFSDQGHDSNVVVGIIHEMVRVGGEVRARGEWLDTPEAEEAFQLAESFGKYWVSIDADDIDHESVSIELTDDGREVVTYTDARVAASCMVSIPAFQEAFIQNGEMPEDYFSEGAALTAGGGWCAPSSWFKEPEKIDKALNIDGEHTFGYIAEWGVCHISYPGACTEAPTSETDYSFFKTGEIETDDGTWVSVGALTVATGHAAGNLRARPAAAHYDNTGTVWAYVACGENERGIWFSGMVKPGTDEDTIKTVRASGRLSGDWREINGNLELVAALTVNVPGFPIMKPSANIAAGQQVSLVAAGVPEEIGQAKITVNVGLAGEDIAKIAAAIVDEKEARKERKARVAALREKVGL